MNMQVNSRMLAPNPEWTFPESMQQLLADGEEEFVAELIEVFKIQTLARMRLLREAVEQGRLDDARAQAHAIKGGACQLGADALADVCLSIETADARTLTAIEVLACQAERLFEETCHTMSIPNRR
jgi:HPt (histidine-containing phosphotransfer) domain-containing protein